MCDFPQYYCSTRSCSTRLRLGDVVPHLHLPLLVVVPVVVGSPLEVVVTVVKDADPAGRAVHHRGLLEAVAAKLLRVADVPEGVNSLGRIFKCVLNENLRFIEFVSH